MAHTWPVPALDQHPHGGAIATSRWVVLAGAAVAIPVVCLPLVLTYSGGARAGMMGAAVASGVALALVIGLLSRGDELRWASVVEPLSGFLVTVYALAALATGEDWRANILGLVLTVSAVGLAGFYDRRLREYAVGGALAVVVTVGAAVTTVVW
ncbi:MAG: hypothetical protein ACRD12_17230 [Acidimicrobiales bacterium]